MFSLEIRNEEKINLSIMPKHFFDRQDENVAVAMARLFNHGYRKKTTRDEIEKL